MGHLQPWGDPAHPRHINLHNAAGTCAQVIGELAGGIQAFAYRNRDPGRSGKAGVAGQVIGGNRLF